MGGTGQMVEILWGVAVTMCWENHLQSYKTQSSQET